MAEHKSILVLSLTVVGLGLAAWWLGARDQGDRPSAIAPDPQRDTRDEVVATAGDASREAVPETTPDITIDAEERSTTAATPADDSPPSLRIRVSRAGQAVAGLEVGVSSTTQSELRWRESERAVTDEAGVVRFADLQVGSVLVTSAIGGWLEVAIGPHGETSAELALPPGYRIEGTVVDAADRPMAGAAIWLSEPWRDTEGTIVTRSDASGAFVVEHVVFERYLGAFVSGQGSTPLTLVRGEAEELVVVRLILPTATAMGRVIGRVLDPDARPIIGAEVLLMAGDEPERVRGPGGDWVPRAVPQKSRSDALGRFEFGDVRAGRTMVHARARGYATARSEVEVLAAQSVGCDLALERGAVLTGTVRDASGAAVPAAYVEHAAQGFGGVRERADAEGVFRLPNLPTGELEIRASLGERHGTTRVRIELPGSEVVHDVTIDGDADRATTRGARPRLRGTLLDVAGEPLPNWVLWIRAADAADLSVRQRASTDARGRFDVELDWPIVSIIAHEQNGWRGLPALFVERLVLDAGDVTLRVPGPLEQTGGIRGRVLSHDGGAVTAKLECWHNELRLYSEVDTDPQTGTFEFRNAWPGTYDIRVHSAQAPWLQLRGRTVSVGNWTELGDIVTEPAGRIEGTLRASDGAVLVGVRCELSRGGEEVGVVEVSGSTFRSNLLAAGDGYLLIVQADGFVSEVTSFVVRQGAVTSLAIELERGALQELRFVTADGTPLPRWLSVLVRDADTAQLVWSGKTSAELSGRVLASLPQGTFEVEAIAPTGSRGRWPLTVQGSGARAPLEFALL